MANTLNLGDGNWATKEDLLLAYNSENNNYKPLPFDFSRASSATRVNKDGLIETVGGGKPRIDYTDSTEGALLLENSATNLITYSEDFSQSSWIKNNCTITSDNSVSPDGTQNADKLDFTTSNGEIVRTTSFVSGQEYTMSFYAKTESGTLNFDYGNISTNTINGNATTEWQRFEVTQTSTSVTRYPKIQTTEIGSLLLWGFQIEQGNLSSYIPTNGSTVQRAAETANGSGNSEVFNDSEGVLFADISALADDLTFRRLTISDNSYSNTIDILLTNNTNEIRVLIRDNNITTSQMSQTVSNIVEFNKVAIKYKSGNTSLWINGLNVANSSDTFTLPSLIDLSFDRGDGTSNFYGKTKQIQYYDTTLTDSELEYMTSYRSLNEMVTELNLNTL